jgi:hypothetical protein
MQRAYHIPGGGQLFFYYEELGKGRGCKLRSIGTDIENRTTDIALPQIWINNLPAKHLKGFKLSLMPEEQPTIQYKPPLMREEQEPIPCQYRLTFSQYEWLKHKGSTEAAQRFNIKLKYGSRDLEPIEVFSCLKVRGLKEAIADRDERRLLPLFSKKYQLVGRNTLRESGIHKEDEIELKDAGADGRSSHLQAYTGGDLDKISYFQQYHAVMDQRERIVCSIQEKGKFVGTGFLIGKNLIMTAEHVISNCDLSETELLFFYDEDHPHHQINFSLQEDSVLHSSKILSRIPLPTEGALDFAIIRFNIGWRWKLCHPFNLGAVVELAQDASAFFQPPVGNPTWKRANIIQYPKDYGVKHITFRDNRIEKIRDFSIHYKSSTKGGSSGSPVLSDEGKFIGLHTSECLKIEQKLFKKLDVLLDTLGLAEHDRDHEAYHTFKQMRSLTIHFAGVDKGKVVDKNELENQQVISLVKLIERRIPDSPPKQWACDFLKKQGIKIKEKHKYCNHGVCAAKIFEELKKKPEINDVIKKAQTFSWCDYVICHPIRVGIITITAVAIVSAAGRLYGQEKKV